MEKTEQPKSSTEHQEIPAFDIAGHYDALAGRTGLEALGDPEVQESAGILAGEFGIKPEFFEGDHGSARSMLLFSLGAKLLNAERTGQNARTQPALYEFLADATLLIAQDYVDEQFKDIVKGMKLEASGPYSDEHKIEVIEKYRSRELTDALKERIERDDLLGLVRDKLGITEETEKPFELVVLSKAQGDSMVYGFDSGIDYPVWSDETKTYDQKVEQAAQASEEWDNKDKWEEGLLKRGREFSQEFDGGGQNYMAFVSTLNGTTYLCMSADTAEKIAYREDTEHRANYYTDDDLAEDIAILRHEYVHTQSDLRIENLLGVNIEERRAEFFSGDKLGYQDIKSLFQDINFATGLDITETMADLPNGGTAEQVYSALGQAVGIDNLVDVTLAVPEAYYNDQSSAVVRNVFDYIGGYDGVVSCLYDAQDDGQRVDSDRRIDEMLKRVTESIGEEGFRDIVLGNRASFSKAGTAKIRERAVARGIVPADIQEAA